MRGRTVLLAAAFCLATQSAWADASGSAALSLAARVGDRSPKLSLLQKGILGVYLDGRAMARYLGGGAIEVKADAVDCRIGNVDIADKACTLTFGPKAVTVKGRDAQALYATLVEAGIAPSGAAGSFHASLTNLACAIDPAEVRQKAGGGARCTFSPGP
jgi:hypothetical protein